MTCNTPDVPTPIDPMIELTGEQLARVAALGTAVTILVQRKATLTGTMSGPVAPSMAEVIDMAEYIVHGTTVIREYGKGGRLQYNRVTPEPETGEFDAKYVLVNRPDPEAAA